MRDEQGDLMRRWATAEGWRVQEPADKSVAESRAGRVATRLDAPAEPRWGIDPWVAAYSRACFDEGAP